MDCLLVEEGGKEVAIPIPARESTLCQRRKRSIRGKASPKKVFTYRSYVFRVVIVDIVYELNLDVSPVLSASNLAAKLR